MQLKTISVKSDTHEKLKKLGTVSDSMDDVINLLIENYKGCDKKEKEGKK